MTTTDQPGATVEDLGARIPHHWIVAIICDQCGLPQDKAGRWCHPHIDLPREPGE